MRPEELTGRAREYYESWLGLGLSEAEALAEVERSGVQLEEQIHGIFKGLGLSDTAAQTAARGRGRASTPADPFDTFVEQFQRMGLSESGARIAAIGRGNTEHGARRSYREAELASRAASLTLLQAIDEAAQAFTNFQSWVTLNEARASLREKLAHEWGYLPEAMQKRRLVEYAIAMRQAAAQKGR